VTTSPVVRFVTNPSGAAVASTIVQLKVALDGGDVDHERRYLVISDAAEGGSEAIVQAAPIPATTVVGSAQYIVGPFGPDTDLHRHGEKLMQRWQECKKRAIVAVARKLAVLLHRLWITGEVYQPLRNSNRQPSMKAA